jgi:hypothetical protein
MKMAVNHIYFKIIKMIHTLPRQTAKNIAPDIDRSRNFDSKSCKKKGQREKIKDVLKNIVTTYINRHS